MRTNAKEINVSLDAQDACCNKYDERAYHTPLALCYC
jgi:hypothetical protein